MKNYTLLILLAFSINAYSQNSLITFEKKNNRIEIIGDTTALTLPLTFRFKENDFKKIELKDPIKNLTLSGEQKFGVNKGIKDKTQEGYYEIQLKFNENKVKATIYQDGEEVSLDESWVKVLLDGEKVIIRYKKGTGIDKTEKDEEDYVSGYIYYDAMALVSNKYDKITKRNILLSYGYKGSSDNPFLKRVYDLNQPDAQVLPSPTTFLTNLGNTDITHFAAGLARFLAERTKEELNEAFFSKMKEQLNAYPELKTAFPKTASFLDIIESYSYASVIQVLKEAFETDVQNLPENLFNIKGLTDGDCDKIAICGKDKVCDGYTDCQARLKKLSEFFTTQDGRWVALGMFTAKEGIQSTNPADLLKSITSSTEFYALKTASDRLNLYNDYNITSSIELSNFISQSLISKDDKQVWINSTELKSLINTEGAFEVYLGLLLSFEQKKENKVIIKFYKSDKANDTITLGEVLLGAKHKYDVYKPQIISLIKNSYTVYNSTNNAIKKMIIASDKSVEVEPQALYDYYKTLTSSLKPIANSTLLDSLIRKDLGAKFDKVEKYLTPSVDLAYHISTKKYSAAIYDASILLSSINEFKVTTTDQEGTVKEEKYEGFKPVKKAFLKYGILISTVANAQSSDEVKKALEASVLPAGSYSIKQKASWSLSINSYVGVYRSIANSNDNLPTLGLSAPIGLNISKGFSETGKGGGISLNLQIIDLGALVNYYFIKGDTASLPNDFSVRLSNIFAPGFNLCYNFPKTPLSIALGGQHIPTLYQYEQINGKNELTPTNAWRWQVSVLIDIPLFNLKVWDFKK